MERHRRINEIGEPSTFLPQITIPNNDIRDRTDPEDQTAKCVCVGVVCYVSYQGTGL